MGRKPRVDRTPEENCRSCRHSTAVRKTNRNLASTMEMEIVCLPEASPRSRGGQSGGATDQRKLCQRRPRTKAFRQR